MKSVYVKSKSIVFPCGCGKIPYKSSLKLEGFLWAQGLGDRDYLDGEGMVAGTSMVQDVWGIDCSALHRSGSKGQLIRLAVPAPQPLTTWSQALLTTYWKPSVQTYEPVWGLGRR